MKRKNVCGRVLAGILAAAVTVGSVPVQASASEIPNNVVSSAESTEEQENSAKDAEETGTEETGNEETGTEETGNEETGTDAAGNNETGNNATGNAETGNEGTGSAETGTNAAGTAETGNEKTGSAETGTNVTENAETGNNETGTGAAGTDAAGNNETGIGAAGTDETENNVTGTDADGNNETGNVENVTNDTIVTEPVEETPVVLANAENTKVTAGTPYDENGNYNVNVPHVIVNQVYGGSTDGVASHSFIELYNQSAEEVDLTGWQIAYRSSTSGDASDAWKTLELTGKIAGKGYYLIRCRATTGTTYTVPKGNQEWDIAIHNKGVSVALFSEKVTLDNSFAGEVTANRPSGYVDLLAVQGKDSDEAAPVYETACKTEQSKKKAVRRVDFKDTDDNSSDKYVEIIDYSKEVSADKGPHGLSSEDTGEVKEPQETYRNDSFEAEAALTLSRTGNVTIGEPNADGGVAEIVAYNKDRNCLYVVNGQAGKLDVLELGADGALTQKKEIQVKSLIDGFSYGDMTSVSVDTVNDRIAIALQAAGDADNGRVALLNYDGNYLTSYETGVQPDMVTFTKDGRYVLTADEGEPRQGYGEGTVDPKGSVTIVDTVTGTVTIAGFEAFNSVDLAAQGIIFNKVGGSIVSAETDLEPEYIAVNKAGTKAYVSLQEANAIGILDLEQKKFTDIKSLGFIDLSQEKNAIDLVGDNQYAADTYENAYGVPMPDGISLYEVDGTAYLVTANEGDAREWGEKKTAAYFKNESKTSLISASEIGVEDVRVLDQNVTAGLNTEKNYLFGGRSFSIYEADTMNLVYNSGNDFESKTAKYLEDWFNCSNDDIEIDSRSQKKGPEPESVTVGRVGNRYYAYIAIERIGGIMVYDITDPMNASYVNYINTRDFSGNIAGDVAPEGLVFVPSYSSGSGKPVLVAACEVSGTVAAYTMGGTSTATVTPEEAEPGSLPELSSPILITEVVPNTKNVGKSDGWEYYEIWNISDREVDLNDYDIVYVNGSKRTTWKPADTEPHTIPAHASMLIWVKNTENGDKTKEDFKEAWGLSGDCLIAEVSCDGMSNSGTRSMEIVTKTGKVLSSVTYNAADSSEGKLGENESINFLYNGTEVTTAYDQTPTPFDVASKNITGTYTLQPVVTEPTVSVSQSAGRIAPGEELTVTVDTSDLNLEKIVNGWIQVTDGNRYPLTYKESGKLAGNIPYSDVKDLDNFNYTVSIFDGVNTAQSGQQTVTVISGSVLANAPALVLTEILPDSSNVGGADAYEFIELYNNSNVDINLKDYKLYYYYPDDNSDVIWWETDNKILKSGETLVFWVKNGANDSLTIADFNNKFGTSLNSEQLIEISCGGMANGSRRGLKICSSVKDDIDLILYNENGVDNTNADKSITYRNEYVNGAFVTTMTGDKAAPTPGTVTADEKPVYPANLTVPENQPVVKDLTPQSFDNSTSSLKFDLQASSEETTIKTVKLYLKYNEETEYTVYNLLRSDTDHFVKELNQIDLLNKKTYTYYFEVSDGFTVVKTDEKVVTNADGVRDDKFNLEDGETISGSRQVIVNGSKMVIGGADMSKQASRSLNGPGKIAFETSQTDVFFKNAVSVGDKVIGIFNEGTYDQWATYAYDIDAELFDPDTKTITVEFHAGNKANVLEHNIENNDDFVLKNIRLVLLGGKTLYPASYQAKKGLGAVEDTLDDKQKVDVTVDSQEKVLQMGDGTSKYEILYVTFEIPEEEYTAVRYLWDTKKGTDGTYVISNGQDEIRVYVDNTAPVITTNLEDGREYHSGTIEVTAKDAHSAASELRTTILLDGKSIDVPYAFRALEMKAGEHVLYISSSDAMGNKAEKTVSFRTPEESAHIDEKVSPENGVSIKGDPTLSVKPEDSTGDEMTVTFKKGQRYTLADTAAITRKTGVSTTSGVDDASGFTEDSGNGFPYEIFDIKVGAETGTDSVVEVKWTGTSNNEKTFLYAYNTRTEEWDKLDAEQVIDGENMTLLGNVPLADYLDGDSVRVLVQNGEGYTPQQYENGGAKDPENENHTDRSDYSFTFAVESDPQYYNEDYDGNLDQTVDGAYQYQLDIHNFVLNNRESMNIQYLFNDGDIIDDEPNVKEWEQADAAYRLLDEAGFPYGVLAGNHDVGHLSGDYTNFSEYFGENRYSRNSWYGGSYKDNRGHYDLITVDGIDFLMLYMGWGIGDEEIAWMNQVLAQYPERKAILNFHEYLLASGGMGEEPQRIHDEVVAKNENVCMVLSGHYHNAFTRVDEFTNADGTTRKVYNMLFDYQGLPEGGLGYMRLMHFDTENGKIIVRTYSPSMNDYDAKDLNLNANLNGEEEFEISFEDLGIIRKTKTLKTTGLDVNVYESGVIGQVDKVTNGMAAELVWKDAPAGVNGWYAEVTDANGGLSRTNVHYLTVIKDTIPEEPSAPDNNGENNNTENNGTGNSGSESSGSENSGSGSSSSGSGNSGTTSGGTAPAASAPTTVAAPSNVPVVADTKPVTAEEEPNTTEDQTESKEPFIVGSEGRQGWAAVTAEITDIITKASEEDSETVPAVVVDLNGSSEIPADVIALIEGKNLELTLKINDGIRWTINGTSVRSTEFGNVDLGVKINAAVIPEELITQVSKENHSIQIELAHDGEFGFAATLTMDLDKVYAGQYANLLYYNETTQQLEFMESSLINEVGTVDFDFEHASAYEIVVSEQEMSAEDFAADTADTADTEADTADTTVDTEVVEEPSGSMPILWIVLGIVLLAVIAGVTVYVKRKSDDDEESDEE